MDGAISDNRPIGIFDSGLGGLTVVKCIAETLPNERFVYFGDTARTPYGSKSVDTIKKFSTQIVEFLTDHNVKMIVVACNTVSATCLDYLKNKYSDLPIVGVIEPAVRFAAGIVNEENRIGVIGTKATVTSGQYEILLKRVNADLNIRSKACPLLVPMIEEGICDKKITQAIIRYYLDDFIYSNNITDLILGCTHYPILQEAIKEIYKGINIINPSQIVAGEAENLLRKYNMRSKGSDNKNHFYASDLSDSFKSMIDDIFPAEHRIIDFKNFDRAFEF